MKKLTLTILAIILSAALFASCNDDKKTGTATTPSPNEEIQKEEYTLGLEYSLLDDGTYSVAIGEATSVEHIIIPASHDGVSVTEIAKSGFQNAASLKTIQLPDTIKSIGAQAFADCTSLESINIPSGVTKIDGHTFIHCDKLKSIVIPEGVTVIAIKAFEGSGLESISLPDSLEVIGTRAFYSCIHLESIVIPEKVTRIDESAFNSCTKLKKVVLPQSLTQVGKYVLSNCYELEHAYYTGTPEQFKQIDDYRLINVNVKFNYAAE